MQNVEMADEISFTKGQFVVACINILVRSQSFFPKMTRIAFQKSLSENPSTLECNVSTSEVQRC